MIVGIDEVGRGPWAGPLVFGAVVLGDSAIDGLADSKALSKKRREAIAQEIHDKAAGVGLGWVNAAEIDEAGLAAALRLGCRRALEQIKVPYQQIIIDGTINFLKDTGKGPYVTTLKKADSIIPSVSAASIVAKVARDAYMTLQDDMYPGYGFGAHVGYGTAQHRQALQAHGPCPLHRMSFAPLAAYTTREVLSRGKTVPASVGSVAEQKAAEYLVNRGFVVIERNWKTKWCEIDIVAHKDSRLHFIEVKYRRGRTSGDGLAAITLKKQRQMRFSAELWLSSHQREYRVAQEVVLSAISLSGDYEVEEFIEIV